MKAKFIYSHLNGQEWLMVHHPELWKEVLSTIDAVDANKCKTKESEEQSMIGKMLYAPGPINDEFSREFQSRNWKPNRFSYFVTDSESITQEIVNLDAAEQKIILEENNKRLIRSKHQIDFVKDRVAVEVQLGKYSFIEFDLFVKHLGFFNRNEIDLGIEIVPTKALEDNMSSGPGYFERVLTHILRHGRGTPAVPFVLIGVE